VSIAYFVSPHGFGHAARAAAVMEAVSKIRSDVSFELFTTVPDWFFSQSLSSSFAVRQVVSDIGLVQVDPLREDLEETVQLLERFWSTLPETAESIVAEWGDALPEAVVSDISPLGLEVARLAGLRSILIENFTWDWIYSAYRDRSPALARFGDLYAELASTASTHVQCEPACRAVSEAVTVKPVSREARSSTAETRRALGLDEGDDRPFILLTMGGLGWRGEGPTDDDARVIVTLGGCDRLERSAGVVRLPNRSPVYPPDLMRAADAVVGKLGYSTVAECYRAGTRLGFVRRPGFPESPILEAFVKERLPAVEMEIAPGAGPDRWRTDLERLLALPSGPAVAENGATEIARLLTRPES